MTQIERVGNRISVKGDLRDFPLLLAQLHQGINDAGYSEMVLDMAECTSAFQNSMLSVCSQAIAYREAGIEINLLPPADKKLLNLFTNTNWGHYLDPRRFEPSRFRGHTRVPATRYTSPEQQHDAVNRIVNTMLGALPDLKRSDIAAFEWAVNEITDNVLMHSDSRIGGLVQVSTFHRNRKIVEFVVSDAGVGIPYSLKSGRGDIGSDTQALDQAIREGVTRDKNIGQGNGLFGTYSVCSKSNGSFQVYSGHARLEYKPKKGLSISNKTIPYGGTLVVASIDFSDPELLSHALRFDGKEYRPVDYIETQYESCDSGDIMFYLAKESHGFGSRVSGLPIRNKISNLLQSAPSNRIIVDFEGVPVVSSSFADEAFGKLFLELGPMRFTQRLHFVNTVDTVRWLIDKAIMQRMQDVEA